MSSADSKPTGAEPDLSKSLADRLTFPDSKSKSNGDAPSKFNWADEVTTPVDENKKPTPPTSSAEKKEDTSSLTMAQTDGANVWISGSSLAEPEFDVNVKLADLQADPNNPLYSVKSFQDLNLYVLHHSIYDIRH
jgi:ATP-dependent RNA helicase DDX19/DBP5